MPYAKVNIKIFQIKNKSESWKNLTDSGVCKLADAISNFSTGLIALNFSFVSWELSDKAIEKVAETLNKFSEYLRELMIGFERFIHNKSILTI